VDLGCGTGASLCYLAQEIPSITASGLTLSPVQVRLANARIQQSGAADRLTCLEGDYADAAALLGAADVAYAIESFVHSSDPRRFLEQCHALLRPGGLLIVCDDFLRLPAHAPADGGRQRAVERFRNGWHVNTLVGSIELQWLAHQAGFAHESTTDLTGYLELNRSRDRAARALVRVADWLPIRWRHVDYLVGGDALRRCLQRGWIGYELAVFRRSES
jgi:SAM-dependent methyltransferase